MKVKAPLLTVVGAVLIAAVILIVNHNNTKNEGLYDLGKERGHVALAQSLVERTQLFEEWIASARYIATKTNDPEAQAICDFIEQSGVIAEPDEEGARFLENGHPNQQHYFALVMITERDGGLKSLDWRRAFVATEGAAAQFIPDAPLMIIKSHRPTGDLQRGIILLHEGRHAREYLTSPYNWQDARTYCEHERDTHDFQNRISELLFGKPYIDIVEHLADEIEQEFSEAGVKPGEAVGYRLRSFDELDPMMPALSDFDRDFRDTSVWVHANFRVLERHFGKEAQEPKALFLFNVYERQGIFQVK